MLILQLTFGAKTQKLTFLTSNSGCKSGTGGIFVNLNSTGTGKQHLPQLWALQSQHPPPTSPSPHLFSVEAVLLPGSFTPCCLLTKSLTLRVGVGFLGNKNRLLSSEDCHPSPLFCKSLTGAFSRSAA